MSATITVSPVYTPADSTVQIVVTGAPSSPDRTKMYLSVQGVGTLKTATYNGTRHVFQISAQECFKNLSEDDTYVIVYVGFSRPDYNFGFQEESNRVTLYRQSPLAKPVITSITPKSPKISEELTITWNQVKHADYYELYVIVEGHSYRVQSNISAARFGTTVSTKTVPNITFPGLKQEGSISYAILAHSYNSNLYTSSQSDYKRVNLELASNLRYRLWNSWIRGTPYIKAGGQWRKAVKTYIKVNGVWRNA